MPSWTSFSVGAVFDLHTVSYIISTHVTMATDLLFACLMFEKNLESRRQIEKFENNDEIGQQYL